METPRDLGCADVWQASLERSLARRGKLPRSSPELNRLRPDRNLALEELTYESALYWQARRRAAAKRPLMPAAVGVGGVSTLALLAATTLPGLLGGRGAGAGAGAGRQAQLVSAVSTARIREPVSRPGSPSPTATNSTTTPSPAAPSRAPSSAGAAASTGTAGSTGTAASTGASGLQAAPTAPAMRADVARLAASADQPARALVASPHHNAVPITPLHKPRATHHRAPRAPRAGHTSRPTIHVDHPHRATSRPTIHVDHPHRATSRPTIHVDHPHRATSRAATHVDHPHRTTPSHLSQTARPATPPVGQRHTAPGPARPATPPAGSSRSAGPTGSAPSPSTGYVNPLAGADVTPERIDQGVDYAGSGPLGAIGEAKVTYLSTSGTGWPGAFIEYQLLDGPDAGRYVYYAEGVSPAAGLSVGLTLRAGQPVAYIIPGSSSGIEIGWGAGVGTETAAAASGQWSPTDDDDSVPSPSGESFSSLIASLSGPPGKIEG